MILPLLTGVPRHITHKTRQSPRTTPFHYHVRARPPHVTTGEKNGGSIRLTAADPFDCFVTHTRDRINKGWSAANVTDCNWYMCQLCLRKIWPFCV